MNTIEPSSQGWANEPAARKSSKTWIWILAGAFVVCLCLGLIASGIGLYSYLKTKPAEVFPVVNSPVAPVVTATHFLAPTAVPPVELPTTLIIEAYEPPLSGQEYYSLYQYASDFIYEDQFSPVVNTYDIEMWARETVVIDSGWCTIDNDTLEQNFEHITFELVVDGESLDVNDLFIYNEQREDRLCRIYSGIVQAWPPGDHVIIQTRIFDTLINDGWNDYQAGEYTEIFNIHVTE